MEDDVAAAKAHVEGCAACQAYFRQDRALLDAYERLREERAPRDVRERVFDALAVERASGGAPPRRRPALGRFTTLARAVPLLAAAALAAVFLARSRSASPPRQDGAMFVEDYLRRAVGEDHINTRDPDEVARFLARELGMRLVPLAAPGLSLEGAEICLLEGRRGAMIVYKKNGRSVSHYLVPRDGTTARDPALLRSSLGGSDDMPVVTWSTPMVEQALVGDLSAEELMRLARMAGSL